MKETCHILKGIDIDQDINFMVCGASAPPDGSMYWMTMWTCQMFEEDYAIVNCDGCLELFGLQMLGEVGE